MYRQIDLLDEGIQAPDHYASPTYDVVGITCVVASANRAYEGPSQRPKTFAGSIRILNAIDELGEIEGPLRPVCENSLPMLKEVLRNTLEGLVT